MTFGAGRFGVTPFGAGVATAAPANPTYTPSLPLRIIVCAGVVVGAKAWLQVKVYARYARTVPLKVSVTKPRYAPTAPLKITVFGRYAPAAPLAITVSVPVVAPAAGGSAYVWGARVLLAGVDVSARVTGQIVVEAEEGAARVAHVALAPAGVTVALSSLARAALIVELERFGSAGQRTGLYRLFTGIVDTPEYDPATRVLSLTASDARQAKVAAMTRAQIDVLTPDAVWSPHVFDRYALPEQYLADRLSTVAGAVDCDAWGALGYTPWSGVAVRSFGDDLILDGSLRPRLAAAASARRSRLALTYRRPQAVVRCIAFRYDAPELSVQFYQGIRALTRNAVEQALSGTGATIVGGINFTDYPLKAVIDGGKGVVQTPAADAKALCLAAGAWLNRRYSRWIDESWTVEVGTEGVRVDESRQVAVEWDATDNDTRVQRTGAVTAFETLQKAGPLPYIPPRAALGETIVDHVPDGQPDATAFATAYRAAVLAAGKAHAESLRGSTIGFSIALDPTVTLRNFVSVAASACSGAGKVVRVSHHLDIDAGSAISDVEIECVSASLPAVADPVRQAIPAAIKPGALTAEAWTWLGGMISSKVWDETTMFGFSTNVSPAVPGAPLYPEQFSVRVPGIEEAAQGTVTVPPTCSMRSGYNVIEALTSTDGFAVGVKIAGDGIPSGTKITALDTTARRATLSANCTATAVEREVRVETRQYINRLVVRYSPTITRNGPNVGA